MCGAALDGFLHQPLYVVAGYFFGWFFKELSGKLHELLDEVALLKQHDFLYPH